MAIRVQTTVDRLAAIGNTSSDHLSAQRQGLDAVLRVLPADAATFGTVDPATVLWTSCVIHGISPDPQREAFMFDNEYRQEDLLRIADLARGEQLAGRSSAFPEHVQNGSTRLQVLRSYGAVDELRCALVDGDNCWGSFELYRVGKSAPFTNEDVKLAASLSKPFARMIRLTLLRQAAGEPASLDEPPGVLVLTRDGEVDAQSPACEEWMAELGANSGIAPIVRAMVMRLSAESMDTISTVAPRASGGWARLHATRLSHGGDEKYSVVVEPVKPPALPDMIAQVYGFTPRESEVIMWMARGLSYKEIATRLGISAHTVNDHAKSVFAKAGVSGRQQLIAALFFDHCLPMREIDAIPGPYGWFLNPATTGRVAD